MASIDRPLPAPAVQAARQADARGGAADTLIVGSSPDRAIVRWLVRIGLAVLGTLLAANLLKFAHLARFAIGYPYALDYGEGIVWQQMRNIVAGQGYAPLGVFPAIVYHYPPVYHLTVAAFAALARLDQLAAGRIVSVASALATMALTGALAAACVADDEDRRIRVTVAAFAGICLASFPEFVCWAMTMRVDLLAASLGLGGLLLSVRAVERPRLAILAATLFTLAIYTKQTSVAAPAAAFAMLWLARRQAALVLLVTCLLLGLIVLGWISYGTHGGFLRHIVGYNVNRLDLRLAGKLLAFERGEAGFLATAALGAAVAWQRLRAGGSLAARLRVDRSLCATLGALLFLGIKLLMMPLMFKSGANTNYLVEWVSALAIFVGLALTPALRFAAGRGGEPGVVLLVLLAISLPAQAAAIRDRTPTPAQQREQVARLDRVAAMIRASPRPVISDDMVLLIRAGKPVLWEPAIAAELAHSGRYDERAFARLVRAGTFGFAFTEGDRGTELFDQRYDPIVADAIDAAFPVRVPVGEDEVLHLPRR